MCGVVGFVSYVKKAELIDEFVKKVRTSWPRQFEIKNY